ncbi:Uncharacterised protein [Mycobacteroides abscessus]|nr:Uncharacterised protein [Mycobacteroides abscessus]SKM85493.1 Uncharacterised protein [Mycobacteroides abscessus subsp. massiliense]
MTGANSKKVPATATTMRPDGLRRNSMIPPTTKDTANIALSTATTVFRVSIAPSAEVASGGRYSPRRPKESSVARRAYMAQPVPTRHISAAMKHKIAAQ